mmetsp:Transcript_27995/g.66710  ORF Transcript_27995/g.66710 Transcript_27995/m.66710 type:complete len:80 (-) Transcript_27995:254-493(-)
MARSAFGESAEEAAHIGYKLFPDHNPVPFHQLHPSSKLFNYRGSLHRQSNLHPNNDTQSSLNIHVLTKKILWMTSYVTR